MPYILGSLFHMDKFLKSDFFFAGRHQAMETDHLIADTMTMLPSSGHPQLLQKSVFWHYGSSLLLP